MHDALLMKGDTLEALLMKLKFHELVVEIFASLEMRVSFFGRGENSSGDHIVAWKPVGRKLLKVLMHY
jgi:hypothetical protein